MKPMLSLLTLLTAASMSLSSCLGDDKAEEKGTVVYGGSGCINYVTDLETNESFISTQPSYKVDFNYTKQLAKIEMSGIQLSQSFGALSFQLPEMKAEPNHYYTKMEGTDIVPTNATSQYVFSSLLFRYSNRIWDGNFYPVYQINYTINNRYRINVVPTALLLFGTTTAECRPDDETAQIQHYNYRGGEFDIYNFVLVPLSIEEATATGATHNLMLKIQAARFSEGMNAFDMMLEKLPVTFNANGYTSAMEQGVSVHPKNANGSEIEKVSVSNLKFTASTSTASLLTFDVKFDGYQNINATYKVTATIDNFIIEETTGK